MSERKPTKQNRTSRRDFMRTAATASVAAGAITYFPWAQKSFANPMKNDRPRIGCIGMGGMGMGDANEHNRFGDIVAVCDVDALHLEKARIDENIGKGKADAYADYRKVLERNDIDIVSVVTPDHWHVKIAVEALAAGKHVFCQKPLTLTLEENQIIRAACKKHSDKIFFVGTQQRSEPNLFLRAVNMVHKGLLGNITNITVGINGCPVGGPFPKVDPPKELDWDRWLGQTPKVEYRKERCHGDFRWWYEYSGGKFTDWGAHHVDIATWAIQQTDAGMGPTIIDGTDAKHSVPFKDGWPTADDSFNTAHDFAIHCQFPGGIAMNITSRGDNGILFEGTKGRMFVNRERITGKPIEEQWDQDQFGPDDLKTLYKGKPHEGHKENFYRCIAEGGLPVSDVFSHVQIMNTCHLAAISARLGRPIRWDAKAETILGDKQAAKFFRREPRAGFEIDKS